MLLELFNEELLRNDSKLCFTYFMSHKDTGNCEYFPTYKREV